MNKSPAPLKNSFLTGFTLLELMVVISIILILTAIIFFVLKPNEILSKTRDHQRIINLTSYETNIRLALLEPELSDNIGIPNVIYLSLKDSSANCDSFSSNIPVLPSGWSYKCSINPTKDDGTGWLPLNFSSSSFAKSNDLKLDPLNKPPYYYSYVANGKKFELTAYLENAENRATSSSPSADDEGTTLELYETGSDKIITPIGFEEGRVEEKGVITTGIWTVRDNNYLITNTNPKLAHDRDESTGINLPYIPPGEILTDYYIEQDFEMAFDLSKFKIYSMETSGPNSALRVEMYSSSTGLWAVMIPDIDQNGWVEFNIGGIFNKWRIYPVSGIRKVNEMKIYGTPTEEPPPGPGPL